MSNKKSVKPFQASKHMGPANFRSLQPPLDLQSKHTEGDVSAGFHQGSVNHGSTETLDVSRQGRGSGGSSAGVPMSLGCSGWALPSADAGTSAG